MMTTMSDVAGVPDDLARSSRSLIWSGPMRVCVRTWQHCHVMLYSDIIVWVSTSASRSGAASRLFTYAGHENLSQLVLNEFPLPHLTPVDDSSGSIFNPIDEAIFALLIRGDPSRTLWLQPVSFGSFCELLPLLCGALLANRDDDLGNNKSDAAAWHAPVATSVNERSRWTQSLCQRARHVAKSFVEEMSAALKTHCLGMFAAGVDAAQLNEVFGRIDDLCTAAVGMIGLRLATSA
jgi:hypothetical protein